MKTDDQDPQGSPKVRRVAAGPVKVDGGLLRLAELEDGSGRVERWDGAAWVPGGGDVSEVMKGAPATPEILAAYGVPAEPPAKPKKPYSEMTQEERSEQLRGLLDCYRKGLNEGLTAEAEREERERRGETQQDAPKD